MKNRPSIALELTFVALVYLCGCSGISEGPPKVRKGVGVECKSDDDCRNNLVCSKNKCKPCECVKSGDPCELTGECKENLFCNYKRVCAASGDGAEGDSCESTEDCQKGLVCSLEGLARICAELGDSDIGKSCETTSDCLAGLTCANAPGSNNTTDESDAQLQCLSLPSPVDLVLPGLWEGVKCEQNDDPPTAYFVVPSKSEEQADFYRLPFPNDIRRTAGGIDLSGHPVPPTQFAPHLNQLITATAEDVSGFALTPAIIFRFSEYFQENVDIDQYVQIVDITPGSPTYDEGHSRHWASSESDTNYLCGTWLALAPAVGEPLRANTTYAAYITTDLRARGGTAYARSADLDAMLSDTEPTEERLASAYQAYSPLRNWILDTNTDPNTLLNVAVFTTQDPEEQISGLQSAIQGLATPTVSRLDACSPEASSLCSDDSDERNCGASAADYVELHGRISLPIFQRGTAPYLEPEDGGDIEFNGQGIAQVARTEDVCFALTVPTTEPPETGYPLLIYAHGTGGNFTAAVSKGIAANIARGNVSGDTVRAASMTIDLPQHGTRKGGSERSSAELFFNILNPRAARDNVLQGAADLLSLVRWAKSYTVAAGDSPTGAEIRFDSSRIGLWGHSQGATHASLMLPYEPDVVAAVLTGHGGHLTSSLLTKSSPMDIAAALPYALMDANKQGELRGGNLHPMLALIQTLFERADPLNFAYRIKEEPWSGASDSHHLFMVYGLNDTYSPKATQRAYAVAADLPLVKPELEDIDMNRIERVDAPLFDNVDFGDTLRTIGFRQYRPTAGQDGHFVATEVDAASNDVTRFLLQALVGQSPQIGE